ncbi:MAG: hypothetical protein V1944_00745 [Candidatus Aenigmatarchaeota archaeon]
MKGQTDIISAVIIFIISLGLVSTAYLWGIPLIQKRQDTALIDRVGKSFDRNNANSLEKKIESVANNGGSDTFVGDTNGIWYYNSSDNSIQFSFTAKTSKIATGVDWVAISSGNTNTSGELGIDDSFIIFGKADIAGAGQYNITYKVQFRTLWDSTHTKSFRIDLKNDSPSPYILGKYMKISRGNVGPDPANNNLIITEIKLLLG